MGWHRRGAYRGNGILREPAFLGPLKSAGARNDPVAWGSDATVIALVSAEDVARVAVGLLTKPSVLPGSSYPVFRAVLALREIIATFGRVLGREVRYGN